MKSLRCDGTQNNDGTGRATGNKIKWGGGGVGGWSRWEVSLILRNVSLGKHYRPIGYKLTAGSVLHYATIHSSNSFSSSRTEFRPTFDTTVYLRLYTSRSTARLIINPARPMKIRSEWHVGGSRSLRQDKHDHRANAYLEDHYANILTVYNYYPIVPQRIVRRF